MPSNKHVRCEARAMHKTTQARHANEVKPTNKPRKADKQERGRPKTPRGNKQARCTNKAKGNMNTTRQRCKANQRAQGNNTSDNDAERSPCEATSKHDVRAMYATTKHGTPMMRSKQQMHDSNTGGNEANQNQRDATSEHDAGTMRNATRAQHAGEAKQPNERKTAIQATKMVNKATAKRQACAMRCESNAQDNQSTTRQRCEANQQMQDSNTNGNDAIPNPRETTSKPDA